jgi:Ser/Thr protein kinase RdoA (MazF antagonist)
MVEVDGRLATLEPFVAGRLGNRAGTDLEPAARALGTLHRALAEVRDLGQRPGYPAWTDLDWRENRWWSWSRADRDALSARVAVEVLDRAIEEVPVALASVDATGLPTHPIHADYHEENLLIGAGGEVAAIIDWDECRLDWRVWDVANALWSLCRNDTNTALIVPAAMTFLEAYEFTGPAVLPEERALFTLCTRATRLFEALWGLGEMQRGHPGWDYFQQNVAAIAGLEELDLG